MSYTETSFDQFESVDLKYLFWAGSLVIISSIVVNNLIGQLTQTFFAVPLTFTPLHPIFITLWTVLGTLIAIIVFVFLPLRIFLITALFVLLFSFIPDIALGASNMIPGTTVAAIIGLMVMHITTAFICVGLLAWLVRES